ncbi:hypothetical protein [Beggiatoa leptomitoformis]|uniref:Uncharacterized protein n=1 Tax=Beggiatoa leptomitoformis TaxID=288004 RepID=A0A2N9YAS5_9GAMM|nr:hypothetical protein [Beggiatoa leptomitoformis]ALG67050.1 hypothetical protein AL038_04115 [Beggiatoa leptomitoformis]AUI67568.1 hypothetical protein BLE401_01895 [Beggiatoa leptomitoformis]
MRIFIVFMSLLSALSYRATWADTVTEPLEQRVEQLEQRLTDVTTHVEQLNQTVNTQVLDELQQLKLQVEALSATLKTETSNQKTESSPANEPSGAPLLLENWSYRPEKIKFNTYYAIDVALINNSGKDIVEFDARLNFRDALGGYLYSINLSRNLSIPAGTTRIDLGSRDNNRLVGEEHEMRKKQDKDIVAQLVIRRVVFADGTVARF